VKEPTYLKPSAPDSFPCPERWSLMIIATGIVALRGGTVRLRGRETRRHLWTIDERTMSSNRITGTGRAGEFTEPICAGPAGQRKWPEFTPGRVTISARAVAVDEARRGHGGHVATNAGAGRGAQLARYASTETRQPAGREIALIFEKTSSRTRSAFEVAAYDQVHT
jgi:hypothetical protein